ncbi:MAG: hypothetical protein ACYDCK_01275 [Thermoplasmatota archaeon]
MSDPRHLKKVVAGDGKEVVFGTTKLSKSADKKDVEASERGS